MTIFVDASQNTALSTKTSHIAKFDNIMIPEPGSMFALLSGLVGLVGFGVRRRK
jgi:hypothetical protein